MVLQRISDKSTRWLGVVLLVGAWLIPTAADKGFAAQPTSGTPSVQIVSPANGTVVTPGQLMGVGVALSTNAAFTIVGVLGRHMEASTTTVRTSPVTLVVVIPDDAIAGPQDLIAYASASPGSGIFSAPVTIVVEPSAAVTQIDVAPSRLRFEFHGQQLPLMVTGTLSDGTQMDIAQSTRTTYSSSDNTVAIVDATGMVTAVGTGSNTTAVILIQNNGQVSQVPVYVPQATRGDLNGDGQINMDDLNIILASLNTNATGPFDARDLNGDGRINRKDARLEARLCQPHTCKLTDRDNDPDNE